MAAVNVKYKPHGKILSQFCKSRAYMSIIRGPLGSGKTKACVFRQLGHAILQKPDSDGVRRSASGAIRNTFPELKTTTIKEVKDVLPVEICTIVMGQPPEARIRFPLPDGTRVEWDITFLALDKPDDIKKLRGAQWSWVWFNEIRFLELSVVREALSRCDRYIRPGHATWAGGLADTNSWNDGHELQDLENQWRDGKLDGWEFFTQPAGVIKNKKGEWIPNPKAENIGALGQVYYRRQLAGAPEDWVRVNLANEIGMSIDGKAVHPEYSDTVHASEGVLKPRPDRMIYVGMDFGLSPAAVFTQRQPNGQWWVFDEIVTDSMGAARLAELLKERCANWRATVGADLTFTFRGDKSGDNRSQTDERTVFDILRVNGIEALPSSTNDPSMRRDALHRPLVRMVEGGKPGIVFSTRCNKLRQAMAGMWHYKRVRTTGPERFNDKPDKGPFSHVGEACEYALLDAGEHAIVNSSQVARFARQGPIRIGGLDTWDPLAL